MEWLQSLFTHMPDSNISIKLWKYKAGVSFLRRCYVIIRPHYRFLSFNTKRRHFSSRNQVLKANDSENNLIFFRCEKKTESIAL